MSCTILKNNLLAFILLFSLAVQGRELSWEWWPTGIRDSVTAGADTLRYGFGVSGIASSGKFAPFWLQSNKSSPGTGVSEKAG